MLTAAGVACAVPAAPGGFAVFESAAVGLADGRRKTTARPISTATPATRSMGLTLGFFGGLEDGPVGPAERDGGFWPLDEDAFPIVWHSIAFARPGTPGCPATPVKDGGRIA